MKHRKIFAICLMLIMVFSLAACGSKSKAPKETEKIVIPEATQTVETEESETVLESESETEAAETETETESSQASSIKTGSYEYEEKDEDLESCGYHKTIVLSGDGSCKFLDEYREDEVSGTYTVDGNTLTLSLTRDSDGDPINKKMTFGISGSTLKGINNNYVFDFVQ